VTKREDKSRHCPTGMPFIPTLPPAYRSQVRNDGA